MKTKIKKQINRANSKEIEIKKNYKKANYELNK